MTPREFCYWLDGVTHFLKEDGLSLHQLISIKSKLAEVLEGTEERPGDGVVYHWAVGGSPKVGSDGSSGGTTSDAKEWMK